jgi:hypothetical protein
MQQTPFSSRAHAPCRARPAPCPLQVGQQQKQTWTYRTPPELCAWRSHILLTSYTASAAPHCLLLLQRNAGQRSIQRVPLQTSSHPVHALSSSSSNAEPQPTAAPAAAGHLALLQQQQKQRYVAMHSTAVMSSATSYTKISKGENVTLQLFTSDSRCHGTQSCLTCRSRHNRPRHTAVCCSTSIHARAVSTELHPCCFATCRLWLPYSWLLLTERVAERAWVLTIELSGPVHTRSSSFPQSTNGGA